MLKTRGLKIDGGILIFKISFLTLELKNNFISTIAAVLGRNNTLGMPLPVLRKWHCKIDFLFKIRALRRKVQNIHFAGSRKSDINVVKQANLSWANICVLIISTAINKFYYELRYLDLNLKDSVVFTRLE